MSGGAVVAEAVKDLGYAETPINRTKYWAALDPGLQGQPWCAVAVSSWYRSAGVPLPAIDRPYGFVYCPDMIAWAKAHGRTVTDPQPGDIAIYGGGVHTGVFVRWMGPGLFNAIEGNTSSGTGGSQTNGGGVYERTRSTSWVTCFVRPFAVAPVPVPAYPPDHPVLASPVISRGTIEGEPVKVEIVGIETDGIGNGSVPAPPGFLMVASAGSHDVYDDATHDPDSIVVPIGQRPSKGGWRLVVADGPRSTVVGAPVLVSD